MSTDEASPKIDPGLPGLSEENREYLREVALEAVVRQVNGDRPPKLIYTDPILKQHYGIFVTLKTAGNLRGCIGIIASDKPLPETVAEFAVRSASFDPRFAPIGPAELSRLEIDISILGEMVPVTDLSEIKIGRDGLVIEQGMRRGLLLPQVATEHGLDVPMFLSQTCIKAGLPPDAWRHGARIFRFPAEVF
jgi:AmmeMemoRadiSam system protein A